MLIRIGNIPITSAPLKIATFLLISRLHISVNVKNDKRNGKIPKNIQSAKIESGIENLKKKKIF